MTLFFRQKGSAITFAINTSFFDGGKHSRGREYGAERVNDVRAVTKIRAKLLCAAKGFNVLLPPISRLVVVDFYPGQ